MEVSNSSTLLKATIQTEMIKKSQDVVKNVIGNILEKTFENTKEIQQEAAKITGSGGNLNIQA
ncbi:shikimate kinase [Caminibacter mediatlanticus TB-2]|uniref:Shikimate kinase n=1 Tax=Caminibacter mediatlanticus TB-2 TaxID=391592 RepID=A0AAI9AJC0_9BACT|nr:hypothetical protein [Caminibacter mediatlanticus]EDM24625.1 shikimate kinase [Caminibacter mediatlanticus TB-2]QCT95267.1 shikimate kinase [Caminibacter mediatlanticus TB-2]